MSPQFNTNANRSKQTFLGMNLAITGVPLFLFVLFSLTVFIFALVVGLLVGLLGAVAFTLFAVGLALMVVLPTIFFTTMGATFLFLWGLGGYYILKWANGEGSSQSGNQEGGPSIGDRLNSLTGGRLTGFMNSAKNQEAKKDMGGWGDEHTPAQNDEKPQSSQQNGKTQAPQKTSKPETNGSPKPKPKANGSPAPQKAASDASNATTNTAKKATDAAGGATGGAQKAVGSTAGTATGGLSAVTGTG